jgi:hypothetical protein
MTTLIALLGIQGGNVPLHVDNLKNYQKADKFNVPETIWTEQVTAGETETLAGPFLEALFNHPFDLRHYYPVCNSLPYSKNLADDSDGFIDGVSNDEENHLAHQQKFSA